MEKVHHYFNVFTTRKKYLENFTLYQQAHTIHMLGSLQTDNVSRINVIGTWIVKGYKGNKVFRKTILSVIWYTEKKDSTSS